MIRGSAFRYFPLLAGVCAALILVLFAALAGAQAPAPAAVAPVSALVLPPRVVAGERATLAALASNGALAPEVAIELSGGVRLLTDATGRAAFDVPSQAGTMVASVPGTDVGAVTLILPPSLPGKILLARIPSAISLHDRFTLRGAGFSGDAVSDRVYIGDAPAFVLAASPIALVVAPGSRTITGSSAITVQASGMGASTQAQVIRADWTQERQTLEPGKSARLILHVIGTEDPQWLEIKNITPSIMKFKSGHTVWLHTSGGAANVAELPVKTLSAGDFSFSARLASAAGAADGEAAKQYLQAAIRVADPKNASRLAKCLLELTKDPRKAQKIYDQLGRMSGDVRAGELSWCIAAARDALLGS
jgi:hypothetical protein